MMVPFDKSDLTRIAPYFWSKVDLAAWEADPNERLRYLADVAQVYVGALATDQEVLAAVAERHGISRQSAGDTIRAARKAGLLTQAGGGIGGRGGALTDEAKALLAAE